MDSTAVGTRIAFSMGRSLYYARLIAEIPPGGSFRGNIQEFHATSRPVLVVEDEDPEGGQCAGPVCLFTAVPQDTSGMWAVHHEETGEVVTDPTSFERAVIDLEWTQQAYLESGRDRDGLKVVRLP